MFRKVLVANRGEIACRIISACHTLGIKAVAIYSEADKNALHVQMADEAICVGPPQNTDSYLNMPNVLMAAVITDSEAVHPGYGYFSEREQFADALQALGIKFIGPPVEAIAQMGDKAAAIEAAIRAGIPVVPGSGKPVETPEEAADIANELGFPILIKAAAGGGGKGIRRADAIEDIEKLMLMAQEEAQASFGSGSVYIEKLIEKPRHIEVQIIADEKGNCVHLGERECSIQNVRHQKMIEEAPFALLDDETREKMGADAVRLAKSVGYTNAGTIEFLMDNEGNYYFIEMNTRLQVEHPVTEEVTGIDIVNTQIKVAAGESLEFSQNDVELKGHAIEVRITAEDPDNEFAPSCGTITEWNPPTSQSIRMETGVSKGSTVTPFYDPMIAKLIVTAENRQNAINVLSEALSIFNVQGIKTNIPFLRQLIQHPSYGKGDVDTTFVSRLVENQLTYVT